MDSGFIAARYPGMTPKALPPPHKKPAQLLAETLAVLHRLVELILVDDIGVDRLGGDDGGVARLAGKQRGLAEEFRRAEPRHLVVLAQDRDLALRDQEQLIAGLALPDDHLARLVMAQRRGLGDARQIGRVER